MLSGVCKYLCVLCVCVCVALLHSRAIQHSVLCKRHLRKPEETSSHLSSLSVVSIFSFFFFCPPMASRSLCVTKSSCFPPTVSVSYGESTNDGSMSAQSAVTETSLNLSPPPSHPIHPHLLSLSPSLTSCLSFPITPIHLPSISFWMPSLSPSSSPHLLPFPPSLSACGVMIALGWFGSRLLPAAFHTSPGND